MTSIELERLKVRLEAVRIAITRARTAFLTATVVSLMILAAEWNATLSWFRGFAFTTTPPADPMVKLAQEQLLKAWVDAHYVSIPLLGAKLGVSDAGVIGGLSMVIAATWFFFAARRENHAIHAVLKDTASGEASVRDMVADTIGAHMVFTTLTSYDYPISELNHDPGKSGRLPGLHTFVALLMYLPFITVCVMITADVASLLMPAAFREGHDTLWRVLTLADGAKVLAFELMAILFCVATWVLCYQVRRFQDANVSLLDEYSRAPASQIAGPALADRTPPVPAGPQPAPAVVAPAGVVE